MARKAAAAANDNAAPAVEVVADPGRELETPKRQRRSSGGSIVADLELVAMSAILKSLEPFSQVAQTRIMKYVQTRLAENLDALQESPQQTPPEVAADGQPDLWDASEVSS